MFKTRYTGETLPLVDKMRLQSMSVFVGLRVLAQFPLIIVQGDDPCLIVWMELDEQHPQLLLRSPAPACMCVWDKIGTFIAKIHIDSPARPHFLKAQLISYFLRDNVEN